MLTTDLTDYMIIFYFNLTQIAQKAQIVFLPKPVKTLFESLCTCVPSFCYRQESGRKQASTIFLPTTEYVLGHPSFQKEKQRKPLSP